MTFTDEQRLIVRFCAVECKLQHSGEESVGWMVNGWQYAFANSTDHRPHIGDVLNLGGIIEPGKNKGGFRQVPVYVGTIDNPKLAWDQIPDALDSLVAHGHELDAGEWFREYEEIHPFVDGNGRTGQILFNWLNGTLDAPVWAPNFWYDVRRVEGYGA